MTVDSAEKVTVAVPDPVTLWGLMVVWIPGSKSEELERFTIPTNLFSAVTVTVTVPDAPPALRMIDDGLADSRKSGPLTSTLMVVR